MQRGAAVAADGDGMSVDPAAAVVGAVNGRVPKAGRGSVRSAIYG